MATTLSFVPDQISALIPRMEEDAPMTFQIALVGSDGIVLASDTCMTDPTEIRRTTTTTKIHHLEHHKIAYAFAGDECALLVGQELEKFLRSGGNLREGTKERLQEIGDRVVASEKERLRGQWPKKDRRLTVVLYDDVMELWQLRIEEKSWAFRSTSTVVAGDSGNSAVFFSEQYYDGKKSTEYLKLLATHVILMGHQRNPTGVSGLTVFVAQKTEGGVEARFLSQEEENAMSEASSALNARIAEAFS